MKILICGLPGAGKTTLARELAKRLGAVHFNADTIRATMADQDFSPQGRIRQARRMSALCDIVSASGNHVIADFVCPTSDTRAAFGADFTIVMNTITPDQCRFPDTAAIWEFPAGADFAISRFDEDHAPYLDLITQRIEPFNWHHSTALFIGRWQPFHDGHYALVRHGFLIHGQVCIGVRQMKPDAKNPFPFHEVKRRIIERLSLERWNSSSYRIMPVPNISAILYGRDVGYDVKQVELPKHIENISGTKIRAALHK